METATTNFVKKFHITYRIVDNIKLRGVALLRRSLQQAVDSTSESASYAPGRGRSYNI